MILFGKKHAISMYATMFFSCLCLLNIFSLDKASALSFQTSAKHVLLMDYETGTVLYEKAADETMFPASMSKIMTALLVFDRLRDGSLTLKTKLPVSEKAWRMGGSKMFVRAGRNVLVQDLLRGVIVQSGNDASIALAECLPPILRFALAFAAAHFLGSRLVAVPPFLRRIISYVSSELQSWLS